MDPIPDKILTRMQLHGMKINAVQALKYHHQNILQNLDKCRSAMNHQPLTFEVIAYINWIKRINKFYINVTNNNESLRNLELETHFTLINKFANKWSSHRSVDDPKGETNTEHMSAAQLDSVLMFDERMNIYYHLVVNGNELTWEPLKTHDEIINAIEQFIKRADEN